MTTAMDERMQVGFEDVLHPLAADVSRDVDLANLDFVPWTGRILVERFARDETTKGGIKLPDVSLQDKNYGRVLRLPERNAPEGIAVGDIVMFIPDSPIDVPALGANLVLLDYRDDFEGDVLGVFRPKS